MSKKDKVLKGMLYKHKLKLLFIIFIITVVVIFVLFELNLISNPPIQTEIFFELSFRLIEVLGIMLVILVPLSAYFFDRISSDWDERIELWPIKESKKLEYIRGFKSGIIVTLIDFLAISLVLVFATIGGILISVLMRTTEPIIYFYDLVVVSILFFLGLFGFFIFLYSIIDSMKTFHKVYSTLENVLAKIIEKMDTNEDTDSKT